MAIIVKLNSISNHPNYLKKLVKKDGTDSYTYLLVTDVPNYNIRVSKNIDTKVINYIDPPGGPRITLGSPIRDTTLGIVKYIDFIQNYGYVITFEHDISSDNSAEDI